MGKSIEVSAKTIDQAIMDALNQLGVAHDEVDVEVLSSGGMFKKAKVKVTIKDDVKTAVTPAHSIKSASAQAEISEKKAEKSAENMPKNSETTGKSDEKTDKNSSKTTQRLPEKTKFPSSAPIKKVSSDGNTSDKFTICLNFITKLLEHLGNDSKITSETTDTAFNINITGSNIGQLIGKGGEVLNALQTLVSSIAISNSQGEGRRVYVNIEDYKERRAETLKALAAKKAGIVRNTGKYIKLEPMNSRDRAIIHTALQNEEGIRTYSTGKDPFRCLCIAPQRKGEQEQDQNSEQE